MQVDLLNEAALGQVRHSIGNRVLHQDGQRLGFQVHWGRLKERGEKLSIAYEPLSKKEAFLLKDSTA